MHVDSLLAAKLCLVILLQCSQFSTFHPHVQTVNKTSSLKAKLTDRRAGVNQNTLMFNFPTFQTADFLLQSTVLSIMDREEGTLSLKTSSAQPSVVLVSWMWALITIPLYAIMFLVLCNSVSATRNIYLHILN